MNYDDLVRRGRITAESLKLDDSHIASRNVSEPCDAIERLQAELADLEGRCVRLLQAGRLLQANMLGCAQDHHSHDFAEQGMPGWLVDTQADIDAAQLYFERTAAIRQRTDDAGR